MVVTHVVRYDVFADDGDCKEISDVDCFRARPSTAFALGRRLLSRSAGTTFLLARDSGDVPDDGHTRLCAQARTGCPWPGRTFNAAYLGPCFMSLWLLT